MQSTRPATDLGLTQAERERILAKSALFDPPSALLADGRRDLVGLSREELRDVVAEIGEPAFRARQLWHWIDHRGETDFSRMSNIARPLQHKLAERFVVGRPEIALEQTSADENSQVPVPLPRRRAGGDGVYPESEEERGALCLSSQVGCTLSCRFCHTGTQRLTRNLGPSEIVGQFMAARDAYRDWPIGSNQPAERPTGSRAGLVARPRAESNGENSPSSFDHCADGDGRTS